MQGILPNAPLRSSTDTDTRPPCAWIMPASLPGRVHARTCTALPPGMPDCLEVSIVHSREGTERSTAVVYGRRVYLIHYEFRRKAAPA